MILDSLDRIHLYAGLGASFRTAAAFLSRMDMENLPLGQIEIDGEDVYVTVAERDLTEPNFVWEAHVRYADIHIPLDGAERIDCAPAVPAAPEDCDADADFFSPPVEDGVSVTLAPGRFAILLPLEPHRPNNRAGESARLRKMVVKVRIPE